MFYSNTIIFDGIPSEEFGLMLVGKLGANEQEGGLLGSSVSIIEDTLSRRPSPIYYSSVQNSPMEFKLVLSVIDERFILSRYDLASISSWLYGHYEYKKLIICQDDLADYFYRCKVTELEPLYVAGKTVGVTVSVRCDAPYAYLNTSNDVINISESAIYLYYNRSNMNTHYCPEIIFEIPGGTTSIEVFNTTTKEATFKLTDLPPTGATIRMDCLRQILTSEQIPNVYKHCNLNFPSFVKGDNKLQLTGTFGMTIINEFPMYIGA